MCYLACYHAGGAHYCHDLQGVISSCSCADLVRAIDPMPEGMQLDFLRASLYIGASTTGEEAVSLGLVSKIPVTGRHILLVEDIIDSGKTLQVPVL